MREEGESVTIEQGLDFLISHFSEPFWPRNVATAATNTKQHTAEDRNKALLYYKGALGQDCRLAIYPNFERMQEKGYQNLGPSHIPDQLLIDIDLDGDVNKLDAVLKVVSRNMKKHLNGGAVPTIIWTGNGVHILQPLELDMALEDMPEFNRFKKNSTDVSVRFMRWAARRLSANHSDPNHNPSFTSCLTRVPGSINSKNGETVKILQRWNGVRARPNRQFITDFLIALVEKEIKDKTMTLGTNNSQGKALLSNESKVMWIEKLIGIPIADGRKNISALVIIPYLVVRRGLAPAEVYDTVMAWAKNCAKLRPLQPSHSAYSSRVRTRIQEVVRDKIPPMTWAKFQEMQPEIAELISGKDINIDHNYTMTNMTDNSDVQNNGEDESEAEVNAANRFLSSRIVFEDGVPKALHMITKDLRQCPVTKEKINGHDVDTMWAKAEELEDEPGIEKDVKLTSKKLAQKIQSYLARGIQDLEITKHGKTGFGVTYDVKALNEPPIQNQQGKQKGL
jgi:hypothetical protein